jgi:hypothetical protein
MCRRRSRRRVGSGHGDRPEHVPSALRRSGLAGPQWPWQQAALAIWPSELSGPSAHERHRVWAECEAQYYVAVLIFL